MNIITYQASDVIDFLLHNELAPVFGVQEIYEKLRTDINNGKDTVSHEEMLDIAQYFYGEHKFFEDLFIKDIQSSMNCYFVLPEDEGSEYFIDEELFSK
jgi:hypothetical protein